MHAEQRMQMMHSYIFRPLKQTSSWMWCWTCWKWWCLWVNHKPGLVHCQRCTGSEDSPLEVSVILQLKQYFPNFLYPFRGLWRPFQAVKADFTWICCHPERITALEPLGWSNSNYRLWYDWMLSCICVHPEMWEANKTRHFETDRSTPTFFHTA